MQVYHAALSRVSPIATTYLHDTHLLPTSLIDLRAQGCNLSTHSFERFSGLLDAPLCVPFSRQSSLELGGMRTASNFCASPAIKEGRRGKNSETRHAMTTESSTALAAVGNSRKLEVVADKANMTAHKEESNQAKRRHSRCHIQGPPQAS